LLPRWGGGEKGVDYTFASFSLEREERLWGGPCEAREKGGVPDHGAGKKKRGIHIGKPFYPSLG